MTWMVVGRVYDSDNNIGLPGLAVEFTTGEFTTTGSDGYYAQTFDDSETGGQVSVFAPNYRTGTVVKSFGVGSDGLVQVINFPLGNRTYRTRHPRDSSVHTGNDYDYGLSYRDFFTGVYGLNDVLSGLWQAVRDRAAPSFLASAVLALPEVDLPDWAWSTRMSAGGQTLISGAFGGGYAVTVGWINTLYYAPIDEPTNPYINWTQGNPGFLTDDVTGIAFDGTRWIAVGGQGKIFTTATSPVNFDIWTQQTSHVTNYLNGITLGAGKYVAYGDAGTTPTLTTATNPTGTWTSRSTSVFTTAIAKIVYNGSIWAALAYDGTTYTASDPTSTWTQRLSPGMNQVFGQGAGLAYGNGWWVATGLHGGVSCGPWITRDIINGPWTDLNLAYRDTVDVQFADETFVMLVIDNSFQWHALTAQFPNGTWTVRDTLVNMTNSNRQQLVNDGVRTWLVVGDDGDSNTPTVDLAWSTSPTKFHADAVLYELGIGGFTGDARIMPRFVANAVLLKTPSFSRTADAVFKRTQLGSITADADIKRSISGSFTADAFIPGRFTADAVISKGHFTMDAVLSGAPISAFTADAVIALGDAFQADTFQADSFG